MGTILVVREGEAVADGWFLALESAGHDLLTASNGADGLERLREGGIDVIVLDYLFSGAELHDFVAALESLPDAPPFVLISSSPLAPQISAQLGAAAFVPGPLARSEIRDIVSRLLTAVPSGIDNEITDRVPIR